MGTKTIRLDDDVYEKLKVRKYDDETFSEAVERLIGDPVLLEIAGVLSEEEAAELETTVDEFRASLDEDFDEVAEKFR